MPLRFKTLFFVLIIYALPAFSQKADFSLYLIGDAGYPTLNDNGLDKLLAAHYNKDIPSGFLFLGDNIYPKGMPLKDSRFRKEAETLLLAQIKLVEQYQRVANATRIADLPGCRCQMQVFPEAYRC